MDLDSVPCRKTQHCSSLEDFLRTYAASASGSIASPKVEREMETGGACQSTILAHPQLSQVILRCIPAPTVVRSMFLVSKACHLAAKSWIVDECVECSMDGHTELSTDGKVLLRGVFRHLGTYWSEPYQLRLRTLGDRVTVLTSSTSVAYCSDYLDETKAWCSRTSLVVDNCLTPAAEGMLSAYCEMMSTGWPPLLAIGCHSANYIMSLDGATLSARLILKVFQDHHTCAYEVLWDSLTDRSRNALVRYEIGQFLCTLYNATELQFIHGSRDNYIQRLIEAIDQATELHLLDVLTQLLSVLGRHYHSYSVYEYTSICYKRR